MSSWMVRWISSIAFMMLIAVMLTACGAEGTPIRRTAADAEAVKSSTLGPRDVIEVSVVGEEELSGVYRIDSAGKVGFPYLGTVAVSGLEPRELAAHLEARLVKEEILRKPQVVVFVKEYHSKQVTVSGPGVRRPGVFDLVTEMTVLDAISLAGGLTALAAENQTVVIRRENDAVKRISVRLEDVQHGRSDDLLLRPGDKIYVPQRVF